MLLQEVTQRIVFDPAIASINGGVEVFPVFRTKSTRGLERREFWIRSSVFMRTAIWRLIENRAGFRKDDDGTKLVSKRTTNEIH